MGLAPLWAHADAMIPYMVVPWVSVLVAARRGCETAILGAFLVAALSQ